MPDNAFLVRLQITTWTGRKLNKAATHKARERANATVKAGVKVYKSAIAADALSAIQRIADAVRIEHRKRTVPWCYDGSGAITAEGYPAYKAAMLTYESQFRKAVAVFALLYNAEIQEAHTYLGKMFNPADYPELNTLTDKFSFAIHAEPMPDAAHFRIANLPQAEVEQIQIDIAERCADALDNANATAWERVIEAVEKLKLRLAEYTRGEAKKFYESWLDNVKEIIDLIPSINVANDPELNRMRQRLMSLTAYDNDDLKTDSGIRDVIVKQAAAVLAEIGAVHKRAA